MPLTLFRDPMFFAANLLSFLLYSGLSIVFFVMPMTLVADWGESEINASLAFAPMSVFIAALSCRDPLADRIGLGPLLSGGALFVASGLRAHGNPRAATGVLDRGPACDVPRWRRHVPGGNAPLDRRHGYLE